MITQTIKAFCENFWYSLLILKIVGVELEQRAFR